MFIDHIYICQKVLVSIISKELLQFKYKRQLNLKTGKGDMQSGMCL